MKKVVVVFERSDGQWAISVPAVPGCLTHARSIEQGRTRVREALSLWIDSADDIELIDDVRLPKALAHLVRAREQLAAKRAAFEHQLAEETLRAAKELANSGLSVRDAGAVLGMTGARVHQLLEAPPKDRTRSASRR